MNYFALGSIGERYARFRPNFHFLAVAEIKKKIGTVDVALDTACGTGQSSRALAEISGMVIGLDSSDEMLAHAQPHDRVRFLQGTAEHLPFKDRAFDLLTVALAFHWFDQAAFLREAKRVVRPGGCLAIYNDVFTGMMMDEPRYEAWNNEMYLPQFPSPSRNILPAQARDWEGLAHLSRADLIHEMVFSARDWAGYLSTQSNMVAALEREADAGTAIRWLVQETAAFFGTGPKRFRFQCGIDIYRSISD